MNKVGTKWEQMSNVVHAVFDIELVIMLSWLGRNRWYFKIDAEQLRRMLSWMFESFALCTSHDLDAINTEHKK